MYGTLDQQMHPHHLLTVRLRCRVALPPWVHAALHSRMPPPLSSACLCAQRLCCLSLVPSSSRVSFPLPLNKQAAQPGLVAVQICKPDAEPLGHCQARVHGTQEHPFFRQGATGQPPRLKAWHCSLKLLSIDPCERAAPVLSEQQRHEVRAMGRCAASVLIWRQRCRRWLDAMTAPRLTHKPGLNPMHPYSLRDQPSC